MTKGNEKDETLFSHMPLQADDAPSSSSTRC